MTHDTDNIEQETAGKIHLFLKNSIGLTTVTVQARLTNESLTLQMLDSCSLFTQVLSRTERGRWILREFYEEILRNHAEYITGIVTRITGRTVVKSLVALEPAGDIVSMTFVLGFVVDPSERADLSVRYGQTY